MISNLEEKKGGLKTLFKTMINSCEMVDVQTSSRFFTWNNRRGRVHQIAKCLDRFMVSEPILTLGGLLDAMVLRTAGSDHWPIPFSWHSHGHSLHKPFRFEKFWLTHPTFMDSINSWWNEMSVSSRSKMLIMDQKIKMLRGHLRTWNKTIFGDIFKEKVVIQEKLDSI